jgi:hypothetical protein
VKFTEGLGKCLFGWTGGRGSFLRQMVRVWVDLGWTELVSSAWRIAFWDLFAHLFESFERGDSLGAS